MTRWSSSVAAGAAVAVTAGALVLAGGAGLPAEQRPGVGAAVEVGRTLVCPGGLADASLESGTSELGAERGGRVARTDLPEAPDPAPVVELDAAEADGGFAAQVARLGRWLASTPCPEPRADWWFVGVGGSQAHSSTLRIANPRDGDAVVDIDVLGPHGPVAAPGLKGVFVPAGKTRELPLAVVAAAVGELAVRITTSRGLVSVVASDDYAPDLVGSRVREWVAAQPPAARRLLLMGLPARPSEATLVVANPGDAETLVQLEVLGERGTFAPPDATVRVPPGGTVRVPVTKVFDGTPLALRLTAPQPVSATVRSVVGGDIAYAAAAGPLAEGSALVVAADVQAQVQLTASADGSVQVVSFDDRGRRLAEKTVRVAAGRTAAASLPKGTRHVVLRSSGQGVSAALTGAVQGGGAGLVSSVFEAAVQAVRPPEVRPE